MSVSRMVNRAFRGLDKDDFLFIYKSFIRPHLEYCVQSWNPHFSKKNEEVLQKVQKRATKCVEGIKGKKYLERLHILRLTTLKRRRIRGDLIETMKILSGKNVDSETFFQLAEPSRHTRGHSLKLYKRHCRLDSKKFFFSQRVVNSWNSLPQHIVEAPSINSFKKRLDDYYQHMCLL